MTLQEFKDEYASNVRNYTVANLKGNPVFMKLCRDFPEIKSWVLSQRQDMANEKGPRIKFLGLGHSKVPPAEKTSVIEPEPVEEVPKKIQYYRDVVEMRDGLL